MVSRFSGSAEAAWADSGLMLPFAKLVLTITFCLSVGALFGASVADGWDKNPMVGAALGGIAGVLFGLVAGGLCGYRPAFSARTPSSTRRNSAESRIWSRSLSVSMYSYPNPARRAVESSRIASVLWPASCRVSRA